MGGGIGLEALSQVPLLLSQTSKVQVALSQVLTSLLSQMRPLSSKVAAAALGEYPGRDLGP